MGKKGFTLIEILGSIFVIALLLLIISPVLMGLVDRSRKEAFEKSMNGYADAARMDNARKGYEASSYTVEKGKILDEAGERLKKNGGSKEDGIIYVFEEGDLALAIHNEKWCAIKEASDKKITIKDYVEGECEVNATISTPTSCFAPEYLTLDSFDINYDKCMQFFDSSSVCSNYPNSTILDGTPLTEFLPNYLEALPVLMARGVVENVKGTTDPSSIGAYLCDDKDVVFPYRINGVVITKIGPNLANCPDFEKTANGRSLGITSVRIPEGVKTIGAGAFRDNEIQNLTIPNSIEDVGNFAFLNNKISNLVLPKKKFTIGSAAFNRNNLPDDQATIYERKEDGSEDKTIVVGYGGEKRSELILPSSVITIKAYAYAYNDIENIKLTRTCRNIGAFAFRYNQLTRVCVSNPYKVGYGAFTDNKGISNGKIKFWIYDQEHEAPSVIFEDPSDYSRYLTSYAQNDFCSCGSCEE